MGLVVYPVFRDPIPETKPRTSGEFLAYEFEALDRIADVYGLTRFTAFTNQREVPADFDGPPWELDELRGPSEDWFSAADGHKTFTALARLIRADTEASSGLESPKSVADELEDLARILAVAASVDADFRLELS
jgi:hypothetical protein